MAATTRTLELSYTEVDYFGCFGPVGKVNTTFFIPSKTQVMAAIWLKESGFDLDAAEQTIVDLCLAGW